MFSPEQSLLLVIDVQGKLFELMHHRTQLVHTIPRLIQAADHPKFREVMRLIK